MNDSDVVIYMHTMHAWLTVQMLWQMHVRTLQAVHMLIVCMGIFESVSPPLCGDCTGLCTLYHRLCSEGVQVCAYSHTAALCNHSFLVRLHDHPSLLSARGRSIP